MLTSREQAFADPPKQLPVLPAEASRLHSGLQTPEEKTIRIHKCPSPTFTPIGEPQNLQVEATQVYSQCGNGLRQGCPCYLTRLKSNHSPKTQAMVLHMLRLEATPQDHF